MNAYDFISRIESAGFTLESDGADIVVRPFSRLTGEQLQFIRQHKAELLAALSPANDPTPDRATELAALVQSGHRLEYGPDGARTIVPNGAREAADYARAELHHVEHKPLTDEQMAGLIIDLANRHAVRPLSIWNWMDRETLDDLRDGHPAYIVAFRAAIESAVRSGTLSPAPIPHGEPFPEGFQLVTIADWETKSGTHVSFSLASEQPNFAANLAADTNRVRCCDCRHQIGDKYHPALIFCGAGRLAPGACSMFWNTDLRLCGEFVATNPKD